MSACPDEDALMRFAEGAPDPLTEQHVEACGACRAAVVMLASMNGESPHPESPHPATPSLLAGRFALGETLGTGGQGLVMAARDVRLGVDVAVKLLRPDRPERDERLDDEVRTARRIRHPNVCAVFDLGHHGDRRFITMERVDGRSLDAWVAEAGPGFDQRRAVFGQIVDGVAAAHAHDVVHRDLKPGNVMIDGDEQAKVMDFGLAIDAGADAAGRVGTPAWWAPEQRRGEPSTARTDVYALGALGDWLLPDARGPLRRWISTCRAREPATRFADAGAARAALPIGRGRRRRRAALVIGLAVALALGLWWARPSPGPSPEAVAAFEEGHRRLRLHSISRAAQAFHEAVQLDPTFVEAHLWSGYTSNWRGNTARARRSLDEVLLNIDRLTADDRVFAVALEAKLRHANDRSAALLTRLLTSRPDHLPARFMLADLAFHAGRFGDAADAFEAYLALDPSAGQAWHHLAWARFATHGATRALTTVERWRRAGGQPQRVDLLAATLQVAVQPLPTAAEAAEALDHGHPRSTQLRGLVALDSGDIDRAYSLAEQTDVDAIFLGRQHRWKSWIALGEQRFERAAGYARDARAAYLKGEAEQARIPGIDLVPSQDLPELRAEQIWARAVSGVAPAAGAPLAQVAADKTIGTARYAILALALACLTRDDRACTVAAVASGWPIVRTIDRAHSRQRMGDPAGAAEIMREAARRAPPRHRPPLWLAAHHLARLAGDPRAAADLEAASRYRLLTPYSIVARAMARRVGQL